MKMLSEFGSNGLGQLRTSLRLLQFVDNSREKLQQHVHFLIVSFFLRRCRIRRLGLAGPLLDTFEAAEQLSGAIVDGLDCFGGPVVVDPGLSRFDAGRRVHHFEDVLVLGLRGLVGFFAGGFDVAVVQDVPARDFDLGVQTAEVEVLEVSGGGFVVGLVAIEGGLPTTKIADHLKLLLSLKL